jgi:hypothetical protein
VLIKSNQIVFYQLALLSFISTLGSLLATLLVYPSGKTTTNYSVPASVTSIISFAIGYNPNITSIYIPDTVTTISSHGIYACENLTIHCQASAKPAGWHENWNYSAVPVVWGYIF